MEAMESRLLRLRDTATEEARCTAAARRAAEIRAARDARRADHARSKRELIDAVMEAVSQCASHRELVQTKLAELKHAFGSRLHQLLVGDHQEAEVSTLAAAAAAPSTGGSKAGQAGAGTGTGKAQQRLFAFEAEAGEDDNGDGGDEGLEGLRLQLGPDEGEDEDEEQQPLHAGRLSMRPVTLENIMLDL